MVCKKLSSKPKLKCYNNYNYFWSYGHFAVANLSKHFVYSKKYACN